MIKREDIPNLSTSQACDELVYLQVEKLLKKAKRESNKYRETQQVVFDILADMCLDPSSVPSKAENADNLQDAITCWLDYDEYSLQNIMKEIKAAYEHD